MAACLNALGNNEITSGFIGGNCFRKGPDLPRGQSSLVMHETNKTGVRHIVEELNHSGPPSSQFDDLTIEPNMRSQNKVRAKWVARMSFYPVKSLASRVHRHPRTPQTERSQRTGLGDRGRQRGRR